MFLPYLNCVLCSTVRNSQWECKWWRFRICRYTTWINGWARPNFPAKTHNKKNKNKITKRKNEVSTYPSSSPIGKFLDSENGVVGGSRGDKELGEGIAKEGNGEFKVKVRAKETRLVKRMGFRAGFCRLNFANLKCWGQLFGVGFLETVGSGGGRTWPIKLMLELRYPLPGAGFFAQKKLKNF